MPERLGYKRMLMILAAAAFAVVVGVLSTWLYIGRAGTTELENWIGRQIVGVLQHHLTPQVRFAGIDYQAPRTVVLDDLTFTAEGHTILRVAWARIELAEIPQRGRPIRIQNVELDTPRIQFINSARGLVGWSDFVRDEAVEHPETVPEGLRLSDVLVLRHVGIRNGEVVYEDQTGTRERMTLPGINLVLDTPPDEQEPGWHRIAGRLRREPIVDLEVDGRINLDTGMLEIAQFELSATVGERQYGTLPPALQEFLRTHEVQGSLTASGQGQIPLADPAAASGSVVAGLQDARVRYGETIVPLESLRVDARLPDGGIDVALTGLGLADDERAFLSIEAINGRLAGIPAGGQPLVIERFQVVGPHVRFSPDASGRLRGWSNLAEIPDQIDTPATDPADVLRAVRLEQFEIQGGAVTYRPVGSDSPITFDGINLRLTGETGSENDDVVNLAGRLEAGPLLAAELRGQLDTRTAVLTIEQFQASTEIHPDRYDDLPPQARDWVARHEFRGRMTATAEGSLPLRDLDQFQLVASAEAADVAMQYNGVRIPVGRAQVQLDLQQRQLDVRVADFALLSGQSPFLAFEQLMTTIRFPADGPTIVEQIRAERPQLALVADEDGGFEGWNRLPLDRLQDHTDSPETDASWVLRDAQVHDATFTYAPRPDLEPMRLTGINLAARATEERADELQLTGTIAEDWLQVQLAGRFDKARQHLEVETFEAGFSVRPEEYERLPQALQEILVPIQFAGEVAITATGSLPLDHPENARGQLQARVRSGFIGHNGLRVPVEDARVSMTLPDGPFELSATNIALAHEQERLARADAVKLEARALPWGPEPVQIDLIRLEGVQINITQRADGTLAGWSDLAPGRGEPQADEPREDAPPLLERYRLARLELTGARLDYAGPHTRGPVVLENLDALLQTRPADQPGVLAFSGQIRHPQLLTADFEGRLDSQRSALIFEQLTATARVDEQRLAQVSEPVRESLRQQQLQGEFNITWTGTIPLDDAAEPASGRLTFAANNARFLYSDLVWPVGNLELRAEFPDGPVQVSGQDVAISSGPVQIFSVAALDARIAHLGSAERPLQIDQISLTSPRVLLASQEQGLLGWNRLQNGSAPAEPGPAPAIQHIEVRDGELTYGPAPDQVMVLPGIDADVRLEPLPARESYSLVARIRQDGVEVDLDGRYNQREQWLDLQTVRIRGQLGEPQYRLLPPQIQPQIREYAVQGALNLEAQARIPLDEPRRLQGRLTAAARDARFTLGETQWPVQQFDLTAQAEQGVVTARLSASMLGGTVQADANAALPENGRLDLSWQITGARLENMMGDENREARHAGLLNSRGRATGRVDALPESLTGSGELTITEGRLLRIPLVQGVVGRLITVPLGIPTREDRAEAVWEFRPDHLEFSRLNMTSPLVALDGRGQIFYDRRLDLRLRVEALQRLPRGLGGISGLREIEGLLGDIGRLGANVVTYRVTGTLADPRVTPVPLGITGR